MKRIKNEIDMTSGSLFKKIIGFTLPFMLSSIIQLLYNAADLVVVSRFSGSKAMASVGATSSLVNLMLNLFIGLSVGAGVVLSRRYGAHDGEGVHKAVHTAIATGIIAGFVACAVGQLACKSALVLTDTPKGEVFDGAILYLRIILAGAPAAVIYNFGAAVLRSVGDTKRPLYILTLSGLANVVLNLFFVTALQMSVDGVALATIIAQYLSAIAVLIILSRVDGTYKLVFSKIKIYKDELAEMLKIGIPAGLQNIVLSLSNAIIQSAVNGFGPAAMAGNTAGANIEGVAFAFKDSVRQAAMTAVSQNYGARDRKRIAKSVSVCLACIGVGATALGIFMVVFAKPLLGIYITDSAEAMSYGQIRMIVTSLPYVLSGIMDIYSGYLRGLGYSSVSTINSFIGICGVRLLWVFAVFPLNQSLWMLYMSWPVSWIVTIALNLISLHFVKKRALANF